MALRIRGKGGVRQNLPVNAALAELPVQEQHRGTKVFAARGLKFCRSDDVFCGPGGDPCTNKSLNRHLGAACKDLRLPTVLTAHGRRHSGATILLDDRGKNLREAQEAPRHRDIRTTARYNPPRLRADPGGDGCPRRQLAPAAAQPLGWKEHEPERNRFPGARGRADPLRERERIFRRGPA